MGCRDFIIRPAPGPEPEAGDLPPDEAVVAVALAKGQAVAAGAAPGDLILAADTEVYFGGTLLGKPQDEAGAREMLARLSGQKHTVYTGVALFLDGRVVTGVEATDVFFDTITPEDIAAYVASGEPMDKAGAYGLQGRAAAFIRRIEGDVYNVIGLPLNKLAALAREMGVGLF